MDLHITQADSTMGRDGDLGRGLTGDVEPPQGRGATMRGRDDAADRQARRQSVLFEASPGATDRVDASVDSFELAAPRPSLDLAGGMAECSKLVQRDEGMLRRGEHGDPPFIGHAAQSSTEV